MTKPITRATSSTSNESATEVESVQAYQALVAAGVHGEKLAQAASAALAAHSDMISRIAYSLARRRYGTMGLGEHLDDVRGEAWRCALEAIANFEPAKQVSVGAWVAGSIQRGVPTAIANATRYGAVPTSWERLARIAAEAARELSQSLGREPTRGELVAELEARCWAWAGGRSEAGKAKLKRAGMLAALEQIDAILAYDRAPMSLDATFGDSDETLSESVAGDLSTEGLALGELGVGSELLALGLGGLRGAERGELEEVMSGEGKPSPTLKRCLREMGARMAAPHCQYAYLSGAVRAAFLPEGSVPRVAVRSGSDRLAAIH